MDALPDELIQCILSYIQNARDVASCTCVSKRWKNSIPFIRSLYFPRNSFDDYQSDAIVGRMILSSLALEELVIFCPFPVDSLSSWLDRSPGLRRLELRVDNLGEKRPSSSATARSTQLDCISRVSGLETLKLWGVLLTDPPRWCTLRRLHTLEIVGARLTNPSLSDLLRSCPNLVNLALLGCDGVRTVSLEMQQLEECRLDFYGLGDCLVSVNAPKLRWLEIQGADRIRLHHNQHLKHLSIANSAGKIIKVETGKLSSLEFLSMRGVQWCWDAVNSVLCSATEVKHLVMKIEFSGDSDRLQPFPEVDLVEFFNAHKKITKFEIHGAMFAALCQKNSLRNIDSGFAIPNLEEVLITVRSPLNAEQKMNTLESLVKHSKRLRRMVIRVSQMKNCNESADKFFEEICRFKNRNRKVKIE
ncbi:F-box protein [Nymphaea thermarum]|nr:F-box protein [Nymphaea thermarum]